MKIGIDAHILGKNKGGVELHLLNMIKNLQQLDKDNSYKIYLNPTYDKKLVDDGKANFDFININFSSPWLRHISSLPMAARRDHLDILHAQRVLPLGCPARHSVLSIHDVAHEVHPECFDLGNRLIIRKLIKSSVLRAERIITVSHVCKREIVEFYKIPEERITVVYNAVDMAINKTNRAKEIEGIFKKYNIKKPYFIFVGAIEPRKNIECFMDIAYSFKRSGFKGSFVAVGSYRAGSRVGYYRKIQQKMKDQSLGSLLNFIGYQNPETTRALIAGAKALIYPNFYEGFGMPAVEAMAEGTPVVAAKIPLFSEIINDAGLFANPFQPEEFVFQLNKLMSDETLENELKIRGKFRAEMFSWEKAAKKHIEVYNSIKKD